MAEKISTCSMAEGKIDGTESVEQGILYTTPLIFSSAIGTFYSY